MNNENERQTNKKEKKKILSLDNVVCSNAGNHKHAYKQAAYDYQH